MKLRFDGTISLGIIIHLVSLLGAGVIMYVKLSERLATLEAQMAFVLKAFIMQ